VPLLLLTALALMQAPGCDRGGGGTGEALLRRAAQHVVVVVRHARDSTGTMYRFELVDGRWRRNGQRVPATLGAGGVNKEREGDRRSPSGVYALPAAFGYAASAPPGVRIPYIPLRAETECVDDPTSPQYNRLVNPSELPEGKTWKSSEMMRRDIHSGDDLYKLGVLVAYNVSSPTRAATGPAAGSCIFLHIWRGPSRPTVGCTAVAERSLVALLEWLDPAASPVLIQGTEDEVRKLLPYDL
jgi:L,D-peptidoglycan transpeptidase YkuD (ErfK/YbiS/YcfS/YnhG family)